MSIRKQYLFIVIALVIAMVFLSSCSSEPGMSKEECLKDYKEAYRQKIIDHFTENEEIFDKIAASVSDYLTGAGAAHGYLTFSLGDHGPQSINGETVKYTLFTASRAGAGDKDEVVREYIDFLNDRAFNIYDLEEEELDRIFVADVNDLNAGAAKYTQAYCDSLPDDELRGSSVGFTFAIPGNYNKADRVDATLRYSKPGVSADDPDRINDHWYIEYSVYWSPAV